MSELANDGGERSRKGIHPLKKTAAALSSHNARHSSQMRHGVIFQNADRVYPDVLPFANFPIR